MSHGLGTLSGVEGACYDGEWKNGIMHGKGVYKWKNGMKYNGSYNEGKREGKGFMQWPNGYHFSGEWKDNVPLDMENSNHPDLKECVSQGLCTCKITGETKEYPQWMYVCINCKRGLCENCWKVCHGDSTHQWKLNWFTGNFCSCRGKCLVKEPSHKRQKIA